jgi:hypothetical protein
MFCSLPEVARAAPGKAAHEERRRRMDGKDGEKDGLDV